VPPPKKTMSICANAFWVLITYLQHGNPMLLLGQLFLHALAHCFPDRPVELLSVYLQSPIAHAKNTIREAHCSCCMGFEMGVAASTLWVLQCCTSAPQHNLLSSMQDRSAV
jgi:hypothetical protein